MLHNVQRDCGWNPVHGVIIHKYIGSWFNSSFAGGYYTVFTFLYFTTWQDETVFSFNLKEKLITKLNSLVIAKRKSLLFVGAASFSLSSAVSSHLLCKLCSWALIMLSYRTGILVLIFWTQGHIVSQFLCTRYGGRQRKAVSINIPQLFTSTFKQISSLLSSSSLSLW